MKSLFLGICLFVSHWALAQNSDHYITQKGLLWEVSGHDAAKVGYVYGTMHVPEKVAFNLSDSFFVALRSVDIVALESDHSRWLDYSDSLNGFSFGTIFDKDVSDEGIYDNRNFYGSLTFKSPDAELLGRLFSLKPLMSNEILNRSSESGQDFEEDTYLDQFIFQCGKKLGKQVIGLETLEGSLSASIKSSLPDTDDEEDDYYDRSRYNGDLTIVDAYRLQDLQLLDSIDQMGSPGKNRRKWMLDERNIVMADGIDSILQAGQSIFAGVGAAHLPGEMGVLHLLRLKGYQIRPVVFTDNTAKKEINTMLERKHPVEFTGQWSRDSTWYAEVPGVFHKTRQYGFAEEQLCADVSNGSYYAVTSLATYGQWAGFTQEQIVERIDSVIYEMVPGKIQERTRLTSPMPGFDIKTKLRRGDTRRYRVFVSPTEVFYFVVSGNGEYADGPEATRFLESIKFNPKIIQSAPVAQAIKPKFGGMSITFPTTVQKNTTDDPDALNFEISSFDPKDSTFYFVSRVTYHDTRYIEEDSFELNIFSEFIAKNFTDSLPTCTLSQTAKQPTQDFAFLSAKDSFQYHGRLVIDGPRYYLIGTRSKLGKRNDPFFNSFSIEPFVYPGGFVEHIDSALNYKVQVLPTTIPAQSGIVKRIKVIVDEVTEAIVAESVKKGYGRDGASEDKEMASWKMMLPATLTDEKVSIRSRFLSGDFFSTSYDSLITVLKDTKYSKLVLNSFEVIKKLDGRLYIIDRVRTDTNSVRTIRERIFYTSNRAYIIEATSDAITPASAYIEQVFNTFTPIEIPAEPIVFGTLDISFLDDIYNTDSLVKDKAWKVFDVFEKYELKSTHFAKFKSAIDNPDFKHLKLNQKGKLLDVLDQFKEPQQIAYIGTLLDRYQDSLVYHRTLAMSLASIQNKEAYDLIFDKLESNQLLVNSSNTLLVYMVDSLELLRKYVKNLNRLATNELYTESVQEVFYELLSNDMIKPTAYKPQVPALTQDFQNEALGIQADRQRSLLNEEDEKSFNNMITRSNNSYRDNPYASNRAAFLSNSSILLVPYISKNQDLKNQFEELLRVSSPNVKAKIYAQMLKYGNAVPRSEITQMAAVDSSRWVIFERLRDVNQLKPYQDLFADTLSLVRSYIYSQKTEIDSVRFISQHKGTYYSQPAQIFFFEIKEKESSKWRFIDLTVPQSYFATETQKDAVRLSYDQRRYAGSGDKPNLNMKLFNNEKEKQEYIEKRLKNLRFAGRARYSDRQDQGRNH
jgi:uncharacterized protein YbaP (TraB family)